MYSVFLAALAATVAAQLAPGPNFLAVTGVALSQSRKAAVCLAAGIASGVLLWVSAFALGISALFQAYPLAGILLQLCGGLYFLYIGIKAIRSSRHMSAGQVRQFSTPLSSSGAWRRGLLVVLTNPKAALMWAAVTAFLSGSGLPPEGVLAFAPVGAGSAFVIYGSYGVLFSTPVAIRAYNRVASQIELVFGGLFGLLGIRFLADGIGQLRQI
ncbi:LysE family translocator [Granulosicoccus sp. 3-233]|uniref:LysE family translocator n=1 Tax=Granulosicoccus sp. 3-233 TaxID=3417969 RepID=UPI003D33C0CE